MNENIYTPPQLPKTPEVKKFEGISAVMPFILKKQELQKIEKGNKILCTNDDRFTTTETNHPNGTVDGFTDHEAQDD